MRVLASSMEWSYASIYVDIEGKAAVHLLLYKHPSRDISYPKRSSCTWLLSCLVKMGQMRATVSLLQIRFRR